MSPASWSIAYTPHARRDLGRLDPPVRDRVIAGIERLAGDDPRADVRTLAATDELRLRVGEWRVRFRREPGERVLIILRLLPGGRAYDR